MSTTSTSPDSLLDLPGLVAGIRWRRRTWTSLAVVGFVVGALVAVLLQSHTAATRLLIVHEDESAGGGAGSLIETDVALLETTNIAAAALERLGVDELPERFLRTYAGEGLTNNVLEITVSAPDNDDAVARAAAIADAFIADHLQRTEDGARAESRALLDRRATAERDLGDLNDQIAQVRADGGDPGDVGAQLESLYARRATLAEEIQEFAQQANDADIGAPRVAAGTRVVDPARVTSGSLAMAVAMNALMGLVLGLGIGLAGAAVATLVRDRPILRRDIAAQLGASVIVQLSAPLRGPARLVRRSRPERERERAAATLARFVRDAPAGVSLLEIGAPDSAAVLALAIVDELAPAVRVEIVDELPGDHLRRAAARRGTAGPVVVEAAVVDGPAGPGDPTGVPAADATEVTGADPADVTDAEVSAGGSDAGGSDAAAAEPAAESTSDEPADGPAAAGEPVDGEPVTAPPARRLGVGSVAPGSACADLDRLGAETVLVVRAGYAGTDWLHSVARQLADQQVLVLGMVLVHPDPRDETDGTLWDGLHTALRGRPRPMPVPEPGSVALRAATALPAMATARNGTVPAPAGRTGAGVPEVQNRQVRPAEPDHTAVEVSS